MTKIERALISVSDKRGIVEFARGLAELGIEIISTGGTARLLGKHSVQVRSVSDVTGFPEMLDGRVKTLHPRIHGGLLALRDSPDHLSQLAAQGIERIDLVCVNLYPFVQTISAEGARFEDAIENIDIGGPAMLRSAAKNFRSVAVVTDPEDYSPLIEELREGDRELSEARLLSLGQRAFAHTARYDAEIAQYLSRAEITAEGFATQAETTFPPILSMQFERVAALRYGENPHQQAAFYRWAAEPPYGLAAARQLQGKELSYNNLVDLQAAWALAQEFQEPACAIIKHTNPCGMAIGATLEEAYSKAYQADSVSAFGSIIAVNRMLDAATAEAVSKLFVEAVIAPSVDASAKQILSTKKNLRLLELPPDPLPERTATLEFRTVRGGLLVQEIDQSNELDGGSARSVTSRHPSDVEWRDLRFGWKVARHVKSNAIVLAKGGQTAGVGAGQMSRVDAVRLSVDKAGSAASGTVMASDAFFPFRDGIDEAAKAGVTAVIQPGGSRRDDEVVRAADEHGIAMVFTGVRHFKH